MKKASMVLATLSILLFGLRAVLFAEDRALRIAPDVDLSRYAGLWYEIARLPNRFQKKCIGDVTADYTLRPDGRIAVRNRCRIENGDYIEANGVARPAGKGQPASALKVRFAPAFLSFIPQVWGDYQILTLSPDYRYALVGAPSRDYLWILSRSPEMDSHIYEQLVEDARRQGFDVTRLERTKQTEAHGVAE